MPRGSHCETSSWPRPTYHLCTFNSQSQQKSSHCSYPFIAKTTESSSSPHEAKRTMRGFFSPPLPPPTPPHHHRETQHCSHLLSSDAVRINVSPCVKKTKNTHDCINNKCQYLTEIEASFSRWLLIILLTHRRPAGVGFGLVYSGSRTQKPQNITSRNKFGKCIPFHGSQGKWRDFS